LILIKKAKSTSNLNELEFNYNNFFHLAESSLNFKDESKNLPHQFKAHSYENLNSLSLNENLFTIRSNPDLTEPYHNRLYHRRHHHSFSGSIDVKLREQNEFMHSSLLAEMIQDEQLKFENSLKDLNGKQKSTYLLQNYIKIKLKI